MTRHNIPFLKGNIYCITEGKGRCIVLLHGFLGSTGIWKHTIPYLSKSYKVIVIDLPGHGKSDCFGYAHSMELMADAVYTALKYFRIKKAIIAGHSMGGYVALSFTKKYPHIIKGLCLFHSTAYPDTEEKKKDRNRAIKIVQKNPALFVRPMIKNLFAKNNLKYLKDELKMATATALKTPPQGIIAALVGMRDRPSSIAFIQQTSLPIMMIIGKKDNILPYESLLQQCDMIQNKECLILEYDGHFGMLENPKATAIAIRKFVRKCFQ
ncbi:MAG: alpha/beta hydrolase [Bacteroidia bacterium]